jgi:O-6-methylguanine DNA methyltransferase
MLYLCAYDLIVPGRLHRLSAQFPEVDWEVRPLEPRWLICCRGPIADLRALPGHPDVSPSPSGENGRAASFLYAPSRPERRILESMSRWDAVCLPPLRWKSGRVIVRVATRSETPPRWWRAEYAGFRLLEKRRTEPHELFDELDRRPGADPPLSPRQSEVFLEAVRLGYYELPRRVTVRDIARGIGIARSTAEEHLRAAESAVIRSTAPLVAARQRLRSAPDASTDRRSFEIFARFSAELDLFVRMAIRDETIYGISFRRNRPVGAHRGTHPYLSRVLRHIANGSDGLQDLPLALEVRPFTRRVLEEVRRIPPGETRTYGQVARRLGSPGAARAVGNALAENPALVVVPCHRVLPSRGGVGRYSGEGGSETKRRLLRNEGAIEAVREGEPPVA